MVPLELINASVSKAVAFAATDPASKLPDAWELTTVGRTTLRTVGPVQPTAYRPLKPFISWPGVGPTAVNLNYLCSQGISPGIAVLTINPQAQAPNVFGNLSFGDGLRPPITLRDCHLDHVETNISGAGVFNILQIADRRWRWQQGYEITGEYNRLDEHGNFIPWTVRSAKELAELCLKEMGEKKYTIAFPPGLTQAGAKKYDRFLRAGERFALTYANPYVLWDHIPAAVALQRLADQFGCRVMFDPITDRVLVLPVGYGKPLPYGGTSLSSASQGITPSRMPKRIGVLGAHIKFQMRLRLDGVGEEHDGLYTRYKDLSYAPILTAATSTAAAKRGWDRCPPPEFPMVEPTDRLEYTEAKQFAQRSIFKAYRIADTKDLSGVAATTMKNIGGIDVSGAAPIRVPGLLDEIVTGIKDARSLPPPKTILGTPTPTVQVKYGELKRRQQIILTMQKVDQVKPRPRRDADIVREPNRPNAADDPGSLPDYYNGYSRDRPAECFGTYHASCSQVVYDQASDIITKRRVYLPFDINPYEQLVIFGDYLFTLGKNQPSDTDRLYKQAADLYIETGVLVQDPDTNAPYRCRYSLDLGGDAPAVWEIHEDIITHIVGLYDDSNNITGYRVDDFGDGKKRANYYLAGLKRRFQNWQSQTVSYNGCMAVGMSGAVQQIQWQVGAEILTTVGVNTEFSPNVPPYPTRKLQENLPPNEAARVLNAASSPQAVRNKAWSSMAMIVAGQ